MDRSILVKFALTEVILGIINLTHLTIKKIYTHSIHMQLHALIVYIYIYYTCIHTIISHAREIFV